MRYWLREIFGRFRLVRYYSSKQFENLCVLSVCLFGFTVGYGNDDSVLYSASAVGFLVQLLNFRVF